MTADAIQHRFEPYTDNGGQDLLLSLTSARTLLAIAGADFCIIAADTRQSSGYSINARRVPKAYQLSPGIVLANAGFHADGQMVAKRLGQRIISYKHQHGKDMSVSACAQMLMSVLYGKRFFPYYAFNVLGGLDKDGVGCVYAFDPVGSFERVWYQAGGSASDLVQPFLDSQIGRKNQGTEYELPSFEVAYKVALDAFTSATERDIYTGDYVQMFIVRKEGIEEREIALKRD